MARAKKEIQEDAQTETITVRPIHGDMHHPYAGKMISGATEFDGLDDWLKCQIEAGKLELV